MAKKKEKLDLIDIDNTNMSEPHIVIDEKAIQITQKLIDDKVEEMKDKVYSIEMTEKLLKKLNNFINDEAEWTNKEALGIIEVSKTLEKINKEGISNGFIYMTSLPLQATHYFVSKTKGTGLESAKEHMELLKVLDSGLERASADTKSLKALETELAGLQQGLKTE